MGIIKDDPSGFIHTSEITLLISFSVLLVSLMALREGEFLCTQLVQNHASIAKDFSLASIIVKHNSVLPYIQLVLSFF